MKKYSVKYKDKFGEIKTKIYSDDSTLSITLRGVEFGGADFKELEGIIDKSKFEYVIYEKGFGYLTNFELIVAIPTDIVRNGKAINGIPNN